MLFSMFSLMLGHITFGFARPLWLAIGARCVLMGGFNGWPTLPGLLAREIGGASEERRILGLIYGCSGLAALLAPAVGATLYGALGLRFPALAPSLVGAALSGSALVAAALFIPETRPTTNPQLLSEPLQAEAHAEAAACSDSSPLPPGEGTTTAAIPASVPDAPDHAATLCASVCQRPLPVLILLRTGLGLIEWAVNDVFPLYVIATRARGGLELPRWQLGVLLLAATCAPLVYQFTIMGWVGTSLGNARVLPLGFALQALALLAMPLCRPVPFTAALPLALYDIAFTTTFAALVSAFNTTVQRHTAQRGAINGLATSCMAVAMAVGPAAASPAFAAAIHALPPRNWTTGGEAGSDLVLSELEELLLNGVGLVFGGFALLLLVMALVACVIAGEVCAIDRAREG